MTPRRILVVEHNATTRGALRATLEGAGHRVSEAPDGRSALAIVGHDEPDLVVLDLVLPDMRGDELATAIRAVRRTRTVPIIALSGLRRGGAAGEPLTQFSDFVAKPVVPSTLLRAVGAHLARPHAERPGAGRRILVADDDPAQRRLLEMRLGLMGFEVLTAANGAEALELARKEPPDGLVSDVLMPVMDGFLLCQAIRQAPDPRLARIPIVLLTSNFLEEPDRDLARKAGASAFLARSPGLEDVGPALLAVLSGSAPPTGATTLEDEHHERILRQLERQAALNAALARRSAIQAAELSVLASTSEALSGGRSPESALDEVLSACLDAGAIEYGALFVRDPARNLSVRAFGGWDSRSAGSLLAFFGHLDLLERSLDAGALVAVPSPLVPGDVTNDFLARAGASWALLAPIPSAGGRAAALLLASSAGEDDEPGEDRIAFGRAVAGQVGQALALTRAFEGLAASERRYRKVVERANDAIFLVSPEGLLLEVNPSAERLLRLDASRIVGRHFGEFLPPGELDYASMHILKVLSEGSAAAFGIEVSLEDGASLRVDCSGSLIEIEGERRILVLARDATERDRLAMQAIEHERLATVGTLVAGVAHEVNNPLAYVLANLRSLREGLADLRLDVGDEGTLHEWLADLAGVLHECSQGCERIRDIVRDLKGFARADDEATAPVRLPEVLDSALRMVMHEITSRARLDRQYAPDLPPIAGRPGKLHQLFLNLFVNAAHAIEEGRPADNRIRVAAAFEGDRVRVDVSDTGTGIPSHLLSRIFAPFFTSKPVGVGTGLGLSICQDIVRQHGGEIAVRSKVGEGATFTVLLPVGAPAEERAVDRPAIAGRRASILVIDDDANVLRAICRMVGRHHDVVPALGGREALALLGGDVRGFDAVVCDLTMPDLDGIDVHRFVANRRPGLERRMIFMTGGAYTRRVESFLARIPNPRLDKPFSVTDVQNAIAAVTAGG